MRSVFLPLWSLLTILQSWSPTCGLMIPLVRPESLGRRETALNVTNNGNAQYIAKITVAGTSARVLLDTGSSDLWVSFPGAPPSTTDLGKSLTLPYAVGSASGKAISAKVQIGPYSVDNQAFLSVGDTSSFSSNIHQQGYDGLLGLGPNKGSMIFKKLNGHTGDTTLTNIFKHSTSDSYISLLLGRNSDPMQNFTGQFTINEIVPGFNNITKMPKIDLNTVNKLLASDQHWQALTDVNGIIGPDGQPIVQKSIVPKAPNGQLVAVFDSGYTFSQVPRDVSDAIYGRVPGAVYDTKLEYWTVPCGQYLSMSLSFEGIKYPVHPLDLVDDNFSYKYPNGTTACIGAFQPITSAFSILGQYDMILGMSFLRNTYSLFNFGAWGNRGSDAKPYIQLVPITDATIAKQDFVNIRLLGKDTTSSPRWALLPSNRQHRSPIPPEEEKKIRQEKIISRWPYILLGCLALTAVLVGICVWKCCCPRRKSKSAAETARIAKLKLGQPNPFSSGPTSSTYLPLDEPNLATSSIYSAGGKFASSSQYSLNSVNSITGETQFPPGIHYPPGGHYAQEVKSPSHQPHSQDPPQYSSH